MFLTTTSIVIMIYVHHDSWLTLCMRDVVYLVRYQGSPVIKVATKTFAILFITDIPILDVSSIISNPTIGTEDEYVSLLWTNSKKNKRCQ
jgi:hypothetical protein